MVIRGMTDVARFIFVTNGMLMSANAEEVAVSRRSDMDSYGTILPGHRVNANLFSAGASALS
jgi:hypothetical protein